MSKVDLESNSVCIEGCSEEFYVNWQPVKPLKTKFGVDPIPKAQVELVNERNPWGYASRLIPHAYYCAFLLSSNSLYEMTPELASLDELKGYNGYALLQRIASQESNGDLWHGVVVSIDETGLSTVHVKDEIYRLEEEGDIFGPKQGFKEGRVVYRRIGT